MRTFAIAAASLMALDVCAAPHRPPLRLAIYYGYPSLVENSGGNVARAAAVFSRYDLLVFGDGLELPPGDAPDAGLRAERERIAPIIRAIHGSSRTTRIYGYIDLGSSQRLSAAEIERRIEAWRRAGADGIFFDEAGKDFGVTPERRRAAVCAVHTRGLPAFMNAFNPDDLFERDVSPPAADCGRLGPRDALLLESFAVRNGEFQAAGRIEARARAALVWRERRGVKVYGVTTTDGRPFSREEFKSAWQHAESRALDGFGWGERNFSADSRLPWRDR